ncbi:PREDICTED: putative ATP-dependent RNA helicase DHX57 [Acropora digitifera]|uniref:putative ATP-dependent RNA helicase DHX57 n=1 Tax=Acropora digitifera TaxID=70779 RepID=UPI00077A7F2A|nr:PREDICTED: putative ATP-dependent RNA helicase DHX57 [Acropora digitifera]
MNRGRSGSRRPNRGGGRFNKPGTANRGILSSSVKHDTEEVEELFEDDEEYAEEYDDFVAAVRDSTTEKANSKPVKTRVRSRNRALIQTLQMSADNQRMIKEVLQDLQVSREGHELKETRYFDDRQMKRNEDYWRKVGERKLVVEGVVNFSEDCDSEAERKDQIYSSHAIKKLLQCGFERTRCLDALGANGGDSGAALESLLCNCCELENIGQQNMDYNETKFQEAIEHRQDEVLALESIYGDAFTEVIKDSIWTINLSLPFLLDTYKPKDTTTPRHKNKPDDKKEIPRNVCRFFLKGICKTNSKTAIKSKSIFLVRCGKTTQIPQFVLDSFIKEGRGGECFIICTQPRRISAMAVAERVSNERIDKIGESVGYQVRLENKQIIYYFFSDFLMLVLKDLLTVRADIRVVLMSATLNAQLFSKYFFDAPVIHIPGRTFPVMELFLEDSIEMTKFQVDPSSPYAKPMKSSSIPNITAGKKNHMLKDLQKMEDTVSGSDFRPPAANVDDQNLSEDQMAWRYANYSKSTISSLVAMDHEKINNDLLVAILEWIVAGEHEYPKSGAILVFLPGMGEIMTLLEQLQNSKTFSPKSSDRFRIIPLHSMLSSEEQSLVFKKPKEGVRKIVLSTNIAETSVTIDDVVFVIDCGKMKEKRSDVATTTTASLCGPVRSDHTELNNNRLLKLSCSWIPRIGKLMLLGAIFGCLDPVLTIGAILSYRSPFSAPFDKREQADKKKQEMAVANSDHLTLLNSYKNWLEVMERGQGAGYQFCKTNFLSMKTLQMIASLKCQYAELLAEIGFIQADLTARKMGRLAPRTGDGVLAATGEMVNANSKNQKLVLGVVCAALFPNVVQVVKPDVKYKASATGAVPVNAKAAELKFWTKNDGQVFVHPKSVNFQVNNYESPFLVYHEKVKTSKVYIRDCSMVSVYALLLFCGDSLSVNVEKGVFVISIDDGWIRFSVSMQKIGTLVRDLRAELDRLLESKIENPSLDITKCGKGSTIINAIVKLISTQ